MTAQEQELLLLVRSCILTPSGGSAQSRNPAASHQEVRLGSAPQRLGSDRPGSDRPAVLLSELIRCLFICLLVYGGVVDYSLVEFCCN